MSTQCMYCSQITDQQARDSYYEADEPMAWLPLCTQCSKLDMWVGVETRTVTPDHFHVVGVKGFHPNNVWHHHSGDLYTLGGSAYAFESVNIRPCSIPGHHTI